ncbi:17.1 kDa class II heat shock protein-like [Cicer arietinum]|uniref:17.1 kDa class II heat shock protein-like n=1 Tax=Cicer arietinum TaxID=3827 RepID=A0A1S2Y9D7_CICAR|nr:17.1 kDa class II heat shock protein-like [Cicer arietinum]
MDLQLRQFGFDPRLVDFLLDHLDFSDETDTKAHHAPSRAYVRDSKAMASTYADILDYPDSYKFVVDMPGLKSEQIKVTMEDDSTLVVNGERRRDKDKDQKEGVKYLRMERKQGKFLKKFQLPENANSDDISANYVDGVLTVTISKRPPPEPKKPKTIQVQVSSLGPETQAQAQPQIDELPRNGLDSQA